MNYETHLASENCSPISCEAFSVLIYFFDLLVSNKCAFNFGIR